MQDLAAAKVGLPGRRTNGEFGCGQVGNAGVPGYNQGTVVGVPCVSTTGVFAVDEYTVIADCQLLADCLNCRCACHTDGDLRDAVARLTLQVNRSLQTTRTYEDIGAVRTLLSALHALQALFHCHCRHGTAVRPDVHLSLTCACMAVDCS